MLADVLVAAQRLQDLHEGHRRTDLALAGAGGNLVEGGELRNRQRLAVRVAQRQRAAEFGAPRFQILDFRRVVRGPVERQIGDLIVRHRYLEAIAEGLQRVLADLLLLVRDVLALASLAHAVALDGLREYHRRRALVLHGGGIGRIDLVWIMAAAVELADLFVGPGFDQTLRFRILLEEVLARVGAALGLVVLVFAVDGLVHRLQQLAARILRQQRIP